MVFIFFRRIERQRCVPAVTFCVCASRECSSRAIYLGSHPPTLRCFSRRCQRQVTNMMRENTSCCRSCWNRNSYARPSEESHRLIDSAAANSPFRFFIPVGLFSLSEKNSWPCGFCCFRFPGVPAFPRFSFFCGVSSSLTLGNLLLQGVATWECNSKVVWFTESKNGSKTYFPSLSLRTKRPHGSIL